jgi:hypothetical protein
VGDFVVRTESNAAIQKKRFVAPELQALDIKATETATIANPTESVFHFAS